jgi:hypothetical protein
MKLWIAAASPVLKRLTDEVVDRHDQPPQVPGANNDVGHRDLLDPAPLAFDDDHILEGDGLRKRDLESREQVLGRRAGRDTQHDARHARRGEQARAQRFGGGDSHEHCPRRDDDDDSDQSPPQYGHPSEEAPGTQVIFLAREQAPMEVLIEHGR